LENEKDKVRDKFLIDNGFKVLRFWNNEINNNIEGILQKIKFELSSSSEGEDKR